MPPAPRRCERAVNGANTAETDRSRGFWCVAGMRLFVVVSVPRRQLFVQEGWRQEFLFVGRTAVTGDSPGGSCRNTGLKKTAVNHLIHSLAGARCV